MEQKKTKKRVDVTTRKNIQALIYFCGGILGCYYSFKTIAWMCLEGFEIMFYPNGKFELLNCIGAIMLFLLLIAIFVSTAFFIGEAEQYYEKYRKQKQIQKEEERS